MLMRSGFTLSAVFLLALALAGCASSPAPAPASAGKAAPTSQQQQEFNALAKKLHSPQLLARVQLKDAREKKDAELATHAAINALKAGDDGLANQAADLIDQLDPQSPMAAFIRLHTALDACDLKKANQAATTLYGVGGVGPLARFMQGPYDNWCLYSMVKSVAAQNTQDAELSQLLAQTALNAGDNGAALDAAHKAMKGGLDDLVMSIVAMQAEWQLGQHAEALELGAKLTASHSHDPIVRSLYASLLIRAGKYARARDTLSDGAALNPGNPHIQLAYALLDQAQGKDKAVKKRLTQLLEQGDTSSSLYYLLGQQAQSEGNWNQAFVWYTSARGDSSAQVAAANALRHWKGLDVARGFLHRLQRRAPGLTPLWLGTEAGLLDADGKTDEAFTVISRAAQRYPVVRPLRYQRALLADTLGKAQLATRIMTGLVKAEPKNPAYLNSLGYILTEHTRRYAAAQHYIRRALDIDPHNPAIIDSMGWVLYKQGKTAQAVHYLERAHASADSDPTIAAHLVHAYLAAGDKAKAAAVLKKALKENPGDAGLKRLSKRLHP